jgi:hypothetical protein
MDDVVTATTTTTASSSDYHEREETDGDDIRHWLGGEVSLFDRTSIESNGLNEILKSLSHDDKQYILEYDTTIPIRFLRAEKVMKQNVVSSFYFY